MYTSHQGLRGCATPVDQTRPKRDKIIKSYDRIVPKNERIAKGTKLWCNAPVVDVITAIETVISMRQGTS